MIVLKNFVNIFFIPELRKKLFFTLFVLVVDRLGTHIPVIGIDVQALQRYMEQATGLGGLLNYLDLFSGGSLKFGTLFALGIMPYITASIMMQMLSMSVPYFEQLMKEGDYGRKKINQYTRYLTLAVSVSQSLVYAGILESQGLVLVPGFAFRLMFIFSLTVGSMFVMWLGEQISLYGVGNGSSMIIFAGIVSRFPDDVLRTIHAVKVGQLDFLLAILLLVIFLAITACIIFLEKGERKVPVQYARRIVGQRVFGGQSTYIPFKVNTAGVMPVIFATSVLNIPMFIVSMLASRYASLQWVSEQLKLGGGLYSALEFFLIIFFSFFYTALVYNPDELAENIKKSGGFIPGIRPGKKTAEFFNYILTRIGLVGALYLATLALLPNIVTFFISIPFVWSGTALLIVVGVGLELAAQVETYLIENRYEGFLTTGRMKSRLAR